MAYSAEKHINEPSSPAHQYPPGLTKPLSYGGGRGFETPQLRFMTFGLD